MTRADYVVVGSGLTGATIARALHDAGKDVLVVERRPVLGGNVRDHLERGFLIHTYGPHYFRTNSARIWEYVCRFASWVKYEAVVRAWVGGREEAWPVGADYVARELGGDRSPGFVGEPSNFEEAALAKMPRQVYERFVRGYTIKQWATLPGLLSAQLAARFAMREDDDPRLVQHAHQALPAGGYSRFMEQMLEGIPTALGADYLAHRDAFQARVATVYTGPADAWFGHKLGRLRWRGQRRVHALYHGGVRSTRQGCGQLNYPAMEDGPQVRTIEWRHFVPESFVYDYEHPRRATLVTTEIPHDPTDPDGYEYPHPGPAEQALAARYAELAARETGVLFCGRLGEYRYLDMDQAIARAMVHAERLLAG